MNNNTSQFKRVREEKETVVIGKETYDETDIRRAFDFMLGKVGEITAREYQAYLAIKENPKEEARMWRLIFGVDGPQNRADKCIFIKGKLFTRSAVIAALDFIDGKTRGLFGEEILAFEALNA